MIREDDVLVWLTTFEFLTNSKKKKLLDLFYDNPIALYKGIGEKKESENIKCIVGEDNYNKMIYSANDEFVRCYIQNIDSLKIKYITINSKDYPTDLINIDEPPYVLFYKGDLSLLKNKKVAIVGTRSPSFYGKWVAEHFSKELTENNVTIVSGLAYGTDSIAHQTCLANKGKTIAILPCGLENVYPASNKNLADEIAQKGLLLSEYKPNYIPNNYEFPQRNRIIAGVSDCVVITEAGEKSGTYHTLNFALKFGTEVFVVPGNINSKMSIGSNRMIKSCQTAILFETDQILDYLGITPVTKSEIKKRQLSFNENLITIELENGEKTYEFLQEKTALEAKTLNSCLTNLQLLGIIKKLPGNTFMLN